MAAFACSLALLSAPCPVSAAPKAVAEARISLPAGSLTDALDRLADIAHLSIGYAGSPPALRVPAIRAATVEEALSRLLKGTRLRAVAVGPRTFRMEPAVAHTPPSPASMRNQPLASQPISEPEITVTARKRPEFLQSVAAMVRVIPGDALTSADGLPGSGAITRATAGLSISNFGPGRNRLFMRGVGDGAFDGFGQGSVAVLLDEARLIYDAPDPNLLLIDIDRVELLEGPQGPLYGTGALGGIVKIVTVKPDLNEHSASASLGLSSDDDLDLGQSASAVLNLPLASGRIGLRASAYRQIEGGWIDDVGGRANINRSSIAGGRLALRWKPAEDWTADLSLALQSHFARDSQYIDGSLGAFKRPNRAAEPRDSDTRATALTISGMISGLRLTSVTSFSGQEVSAVYNLDAPETAPGLGPAPLVADDRRYSLLEQEIRLAAPDHDRFNWLIGASVLHASTRAMIVATDAADSHPQLTFHRTALEAALFGETRLRLLPGLEASAGIRLFRSSIDDDTLEHTAPQSGSRGALRATPSISLGWDASPHQFVYARAATAYRPGGSSIGAADDASRTYKDDELDSAELGWRGQFARAFDANVTLFASSWRHVQADVLLDSGLVTTRNVGNASNVGVEANLDFALRSKTKVGLGIIVQNASLDTLADPLIHVADRRLPIVPRFGVTANASQHLDIGSWSGMLRFNARYTGATHLSFDPDLDQRMGSRILLDAGIDISKGPWTITLDGDNVLGDHADSFAFGNPFTIRSARQRTPVKPRTIGIRLNRRF